MIINYRKQMEPLTQQLKQYNFQNQDDRKRCSRNFFENRGIQVRFGDHHLITRYQRWSRNFSDQDEIIPLCRGTILDLETTRPVCYTFKAKQDYSDFKNQHEFQDVEVYQYYDGTMVNVYYDTHQQEWQYATKGRLDANKSRWHCERSFGELFREVCQLNLEKLSRNYCYSFVLQHQDNKIISNIEKNQVVLVLVRDLTTLQQVDLDDILLDQDFCPPGQVIKPVKLNPPDISVNNYEDLEACVENMDFNSAGVMLFSKTDPENHSRLMSVDYKTGEAVKGNNPNKQLHLVTLSNSQLDNYLYYFPEDSELVEKISMLTRRLVASVFYHYHRVKVKKVFTDIPTHLRKLVYMIHQLYETRLTQMEGKKAGITHRVVKGYFHQLSPKFAVELLNLHEEFLAE